MRARFRVGREADGRFTVRMSPGQCSLVGECLGLASGGADTNDLVRFRLGGSREAVAALAEELRRGGSAEHSQDYRFDVRQLHIIYAGLTRIVTDFVSDEDFHQRTGWYRENVIALAPGNGTLLAGNPGRGLTPCSARSPWGLRAPPLPGVADGPRAGSERPCPLAGRRTRGALTSCVRFVGV